MSGRAGVRSRASGNRAARHDQSPLGPRHLSACQRGLWKNANHVLTIRALSVQLTIRTTAGMEQGPQCPPTLELPKAMRRPQRRHRRHGAAASPDNGAGVGEPHQRPPNAWSERAERDTPLSEPADPAARKRCTLSHSRACSLNINLTGAWREPAWVGIAGSPGADPGPAA